MQRLHLALEYKYLVVAVYIGGQFMNQLDATVLNVALPVLGRQMNAGTDQLGWVATGYLLSLAVWVPAAGWLGDRFGTRRMYLFAITSFTLASVLCAQAQNIEQLILFRILQGVGGGLLMPVGMAMLFRAFPPEERATATAFMAIPTLIAPVLGPVFGGWLVDNVGWQWIFYINLPVGVAAFLLAAAALKEHRVEAPGVFDAAGFVLAGSSFALILFSLSRGPRAGWTSAEVIGTGLTGIVLLATMIVVELRKSEPMLKVRLFTNRVFRTTHMAWFLANMGLMGMLFVLPLYLQQLRGYSAAETGLTTLPQGVGMALGLQFASRLYPYVGPRRMMAGGMFAVAASTACFLFVGLETPLVTIGLMLLVRGAGMAFALVANQAATFATIDSRDLGRASSLSNTNLRVSAAAGVAVLATVLVESTRLRGGVSAAPDELLLAYHDAFLVALILGVIGFLFALLIKDEDVAHLLRRRAPRGAAAQSVSEPS